MRETMKKMTQGATRLLVLALGLGLVTTAWAVEAPNVTLTGTSVDINNVEQSSTDGYEISNPRNTTITLPALGDLTGYTGCRIAVNSIKFARANESLEAAKISITTDTGTFLSEGKVASATADGEIEAEKYTITYSFSEAPVLKVGTAYSIKFLDSTGAEITGKIKYRSTPVTQSIFSTNIRHSGGSHVYLYKLEGKLYYTCAVAADGSSSWVASQTGSSTDCRWYDVTGSPSFNIGTVSCDTAYFNVADSQTLTLTGGSITVANAVKSVGAGNVVFDASGLDVSGLAAGDGLKVTSGATAADVAHVSVVNPPAAGESLKYVVQQRSDGYYIAALPKDYKWNTININFTHNNKNLSTESNVGMIGVPGNKWDNYAAAASASYSGASVCDDTGTQTQTLTGLDVTISEALGSWEASSLSYESDLRSGYIDDRDQDGARTPTVKISGIPFNKYRVIVYHSTDTANTTFGYDTVNGDNLCYVDNVLKNGSGTTSWGNSGPDGGADPIEEGVNTLVTGVYETKPFKVVGHRNNRGCIAAVQVVKVDEATIDAAGTYTLTGLFGGVGTTANLYVNVAENATLNIPSDTTIAAIDFNIATGKTLTLTGAKLTATAGGFTVSGGGKVLIDVVNPVNYWAKVVEGRVYGAEDIDLTSTADGAAQLEIDQADGVCINVADEAASFSMGLNSYLTGTYVTSSAQTAFSGITLQQFYDGGYTLRGRFAGANVNKLGVEATGYNAYVTDDGAGNVTSIRYEMQVINGGWIKCIVVTLTPDAGGMGINVVANGAYYAAESNGLGFAFLNDDGTTTDGVTGANLGVAYNTSNSYSLYGLNIAGKSTKSLTLSGDETLTVGTDIASAYSTLTVSGSGSLTISGILNVDTLVVKSGATVTLADNFGARNISIESGATVSYVGGEGSAFYWATLSGAGTLTLDPGEGNTYTMSQSNTGYTGQPVIKSGTVKMGNATSFGSIPRSSSIRVKNGAALDANNVTSGKYGSDKNNIVLEGGAKFCTSVSQSDYKQSAFTKLALEGNATVDATGGNLSISQHYNYDYTQVNLGEYTLSKIGNYDFSLSAVQILGSGVIDVKNGAIVICSSYFNTRPSTMQDGTLCIRDGAYLKLKDYTGQNAGGGVLTVKNLELDGAVTRDSATYSTLTVTGYISGTGTTPMLTLSDGATLKPKSSAGGLTVTESLTLSGTINVDLSDVDLTGMSELAIITGPTQIIIEEGEDCDIADDGFILGSNSSNWELYSELVSEGTYVLGVRLSTITDPVSWDGEGGTWSVNSFNGGTENYSNQALQTVTFADNGESADPIAVTVSGAKTVNAINFTADNRNITLSGDAITAATVSKSGDGVATVNSALSIETSISVTDGVLILNPTEAVVSDEWTAPDNGTLVVYVDSGETTTMTADITATKLIKRGAGTLDLTGITVTSIPIVVDGGKVIVDEQPSANVTINASGTFTLKDAVWSNGALFSGDGTLELLSTAAKKEHNATGATFNGIFKLSNQSDNQNNLNPSSASMFDASVRPEFICNSTSTHLGNGWNNNHVIKVRDLSGSGSIRSQWDNSAYHYTIETKQSRNTVFAGTFVSGAYSYNRYIDLSVVGDNLGDIHSLTISQAQNTDSGTSPAMSTLSISDNAKVVFTSAGGWGRGKVSIGDNGWLESSNSTSTAVQQLTLANNSHIVFPTSSSTLTGITSLTFASGATYISFPNGAPDSETTIIDWTSVGSAPVGDFKLDGDVADTHVITKGDTGLTITKGVASVRTTSGVTHYDTVPMARLQAINAGENLVYFTIISSDDVDVSYFEGMKIKNAGGANITITGVTSEYALNSSTDDGITTYTRSNAPTAYVWTDAYSDFDMETYVTTPNHNWTVPGNWNVSGGTAAGRYPQAGDTVIFNDGATVTLDASVTVAGIEVNGEVSISATAKSLNTSGNITTSSSGTLTLSDVCLASAAAGGITVAPDVNFTSDSELAWASSGMGGVILNGAVTFSGSFKAWDTAHTINGAVTINSGANFSSGNNWVNMNGPTTVKGAITTGGTKLKFNDVLTIEAGSITADGSNVNVDSTTVSVMLAGTNATFSDTRGEPIADNKVSTSVADSYVKKTGSTFAVAAKTVVTVSVGANVSLTINGSAVADGDTLKFAPGDTFTYVATPAANYTANVAVTGGTDNDGTVTVGETAITVAATATHNGATVSNVAVSYGSDYTSVEVTATVSDATLDYYIGWGSGEPVKGTVSGSTVTFDLSGIAHSEPYQSSGYNIAAKDGETAVTTTGGAGSTVAADVVNADWINENATTHGLASAGGAWTNAEAVTYSDGKATITDNRFAATTASTASRVVLEFNVCFSSTSDEDVSGEAQAAIKLGVENDATTFMVLTTGNTWMPVSRAGFTPDASATYNVVLTIDYGTGMYKVDVAGNSMTNSTGYASFSLATTGTGVQNIDFAGSGTLTSMKGDQLEGYMVKDGQNHYYATIEAATQAYDSANGPYTVLHNGTAPSGWRIDGDTLIKVAKGLFFMAY